MPAKKAKDNYETEIAINALRDMFDIYDTVSENKLAVCQARATIDENRQMILSNYTAAFMGNRQLTNDHTEEIFEIRRALLSGVEVTTEVEAEYVDAKMLRASLAHLEHRSRLNSSVLEVNDDLVKVNEMLIEINRKIMGINKGIMDFNNQEIKINQSLLTGAKAPQTSTHAGNRKLQKENAEKLKELKKLSAKNSSRIKKMRERSERNATQTIKNKTSIRNRRKALEAVGEKISKNRSAIRNVI